MTHDDVLDLAATAIDFTLSPIERASLDTHLASCSSCRTEAAEIRATAARLSTLGPIEPPAWVLTRVMRPPRRPLAMSLAAAALLLAALVGAAMVIGALLQEQAVVVVPTSPPGPLPSASRGIESAPAPHTAILDEGTFDPAGTPLLLELIATPDGFYAHGWMDDVASALMLRGSGDGATWQTLDAQSAFESPLESIAVGPNGYVAARRTQTSPDQLSVVLWLSSDGRTWERQDTPTWVGDEFSAPIVAGPWGYAMEGHLSQGGEDVPAVWVSRDGRSWSRMPPLGSNGYVVVHDGGVVHVEHDTGKVRETRDGRSWTERTSLPISGAVRLVVVGSRLVAVAPEQGLFVAELDGLIAELQWQLVHDLRGVSDALVVSAVASRAGRGIVLAYDRVVKAPIALTSDDGLAWASATLDPSAFGGGVPDMLVGGESAFLALGWEVNATGDSRPRAWVSADGISWAPAGAGPIMPMPLVTTPTCPTDPSLEDLVSPAMPASARPVCFGDRSITVRGFAHDCGGCGGIAGMTGTPEWLADPLGYSAFWIGPTQDAESLRLGVEIDPSSGLVAPSPGDYLELTGHFSDPASAGCRVEPSAGEFSWVPPVSGAQATCRERFVATSIRVITPAAVAG